MKNRFIACMILLSFAFSAHAQIFGDDPEMKVDGLKDNSVWQITEMALNEMDFGVGDFIPSENVLLSNWIQWNSLTIKNRARLHFKYSEGVLKINITDRAYKSNEGWSEAVGKLSKKNYKKFVKATADKIKEINADPEMVKKAVKSSKLIPAFCAVQNTGHLEWKLLSFEPAPNDRPVMTFEVKNVSDKVLKIRAVGGEFKKVSGIGTARFFFYWDRPDADDNKIITLDPEATAIGKSPVAQGYSLESAQGYIMHFDFMVDGSQKSFEMYNLPLPYTYTEGD